MTQNTCHRIASVSITMQSGTLLQAQGPPRATQPWAGMYVSCCSHYDFEDISRFQAPPTSSQRVSLTRKEEAGPSKQGERGHPRRTHTLGLPRDRTEPSPGPSTSVTAQSMPTKRKDQERLCQKSSTHTNEVRGKHHSLPLDACNATVNARRALASALQLPNMPGGVAHS